MESKSLKQDESIRTLHIDKYYDCMPHLLKVYDKKARQDKLVAKTKEAYFAWQKATRQKLYRLTGMDTMEKCELSPVLIEEVMLADIKRQKVLLQVEPDVWMPVYILIPKQLKKGQKAPCVIAPHGHSGGGKYAVAGQTEIPAVKDKIELFNYDYGLSLAKEGFVTLCPDARGFGERREKFMQTDSEEHFINSTCFQLSHMAISLGQTVIGMCTWDLMRLLDYIEQRDEWDTEQIACVGFSGGGMQTLWLAALDERIKYAVISGYFYGYKDSLLKLAGNCSCNYVPNLWQHVDMGDIGALIAPRPLLIQSCLLDHLNGERGIINAKEQVEITMQAYKLFEAEDRLEHDICEGGHKWHEERPMVFIKKYNKREL